MFYVTQLYYGWNENKSKCFSFFFFNHIVNIHILNKKFWIKRWDRHYFHVDFDNIPPTVDTDSSKKGGDSGKECVYEGRKYSHGDIFPSNSTGIVPTSKSQCVNCACTVSNVLCLVNL